MPRVTFVADAGGDWEGIYINGTLATQDHSLDPRKLIEALGIEYTYLSVDLEAGASLPYNLGDIPSEERHG